MTKEDFRLEMRNAKATMVEAIKQFVLTYGEDFSNYYRDEMGIDDEEDGEATVCGVIDIFNNGGCYFPTTTSFQVEQDTRWESVAFHCLYVVEEDGDRELMYYALYNDGMEYDSDISEPEHGYVRDLSYEELVKLIKWLDDYCEYV